MSANGKGTDPVAGFVPIELDRPRRLKWTHKIIFDIEMQTGVNLFNEVNPFLPESVTASRMIIMLHGALLADDPSLTADEAMALYYDHNRVMILHKLVDSWNLCTRVNRIEWVAKTAPEATPDPPDSGSTPGPTQSSALASVTPSSGA